MKRHFIRISIQAVEISENGFEYTQPADIIEVPISEYMDKDSKFVIGKPKLILH